MVDEPKVADSDDASPGAGDIEIEPPSAADVIDLTTPDQISIDDLHEDEHDEDVAGMLTLLEDGLWEADARLELEELQQVVDARLTPDEDDEVDEDDLDDDEDIEGDALEGELEPGTELDAEPGLSR